MVINREKEQVIIQGDEGPRMNDIFRQSPIAIELYDEDGILLDANRACLDLFGVSEFNEVKDFKLFEDPNLNEQIISEIKSCKVLKYELIFSFDRIRSKQLYPTSREGTCYLECYINQTTNENCEINGYIVHITEITERKQTEIALLKSEEKFRRIIESSTNGMYQYQLDENDQLIFMGANPAADRILGFSHQSFIGRSIEEAFPQLTPDQLLILGKSIAKGDIGSQVFDFEYTDEHITNYYNIRAFQTEKNSITVSFTDISERKKAEMLLELQAKELKELNATKDKFLSIIAHDLKNPFNAILGFSDLMLKNFYELDDETLLKGLSTIESASIQAYKLLENLLIWSQNQTGRRKFNPEFLNLNTQVLESLNMMEGAALKKEIQVKTSIKKTCQLFADKNMIDSILRNLISNAIKFSNRKAIIKIKAVQFDHEMQVSVIDQGVGISDENLSSIFKIDKHLITLGTDNELGTGLGLILCKDFILRHDGKIWVESVPGKGSTFTFSLPSTNFSKEHIKYE